jgi:2'-5' RNA ligase
MIRAFLALPLPEAARARLAVLQFLLPLPRRTEPVDFHLTLTFLGEQPDPVLQAVHDGMQALRQAPFRLTLRGAGLFGGGRARVAWAGVEPCEPLDRLQAKCDRIARAAGVAVEARRFLPHVTLGRFPPPGPDEALRLERAVAAETGFAGGTVEVAEVVLYQSHPGRTAPRYAPLAHYPLRG